MQSPLTGNATPVTPGRPSLYIEPTMQLSATESGSILGGLESAHPRMNARGTFIATSALIIVGLAGWIMTQPGLDTDATRNTAPLGVAAANAPAAIAVAPVVVSGGKAPAPIIADAGAPAMPSPPEMAFAAPTQAEPLAAPASRVAHEQSLSAREELVPAAATSAPVQPPPVAPAVSVAGGPAIADQPQRAPAAASPSEKSQLAVTARPATKVAATESAQSSVATRPAAMVATVKSGEKDGDVELIAALLNRVSGKPDALAGEVPRKSRPDEVRKSTPSTTQKNPRKGAGRRESIGARPVDTAQAQLERCNTLGFFEAEMCRLRACTGRWGSDPGCPEYAQNSTVAP
ncbi:hypothetical protein [Janthinobacterium sp. 17J80-10]|uniref:hypothetical protein n=1 Tax=Janthinobacterium sp. 17J80-10 TaxID=2497863 RepID=UPI0010059358|nr:hypothetical protein [Janthinobacterium sp. 17J80-10]QAU34564.1 hypothetical protein EKL02_10440 [Janthinobacterium sp. 17J80-10]